MNRFLRRLALALLTAALLIPLTVSVASGPWPHRPLATMSW